MSLLKVCVNCVLPETFPGIQFNSEGVCNFCLDCKSAESRAEKKTEYRDKFDALVQEHKGKNSYDALMCYSGGKDSTWTLTILKEKYGLNVLSMTLDNGFVSNQATNNIHTVVEKLGIDHIFFKPRFDMLAKVFRTCIKSDIYPPKTLERASTICTSCMAIVKFSALRLALEKEIPFIAYGWSPGQAPVTSSIMKNNPQMMRMTQKTLYNPLYKIVGEDIRPYFLEDKHFSGSFQFPYNIHPLAFLEYSEEEIYQNISQLGWKAPEDVDANSTNCLLNSLGNVVHINRLGFHPYAFELANLVREGYLARDIALEKISQMETSEGIALAKAKLGLAEDMSRS